MKTMTLNMSDEEMRVLTELSKSKEMSKTAIMRQALRTYQLVEASGDLSAPPLSKRQR